MTVYVSATVLAVILSIISVHIKKENRILFIIMAIISALPLFCVAAFRYNVGTDYPTTYTQRFLLRIDGYDLSAIFEKGFILLIDTIQIFTKNPYWLFIVCAAIFFFFVYKAIYQQSNNIPYSVLILVIGGHFFGSLNLMRNFMALAIFLYAFKYVKERKIIHYTILMLIAYYFHKSIIILYPLYFLYKIKFSRKTILMILIGVTVSLPILDGILETLITKIFVDLDYAWYYTRRDNTITVLTTTIFVELALLMLQLYYYTKNKDDLLYNMYLKIQLFTTIIAICSSILPMARRLIILPSFIQILSIPYIAKEEKNKNVRIFINFMICLIFCIYTIRQITVQGMHEVLPYQSIFGI